MSLKVVGELIEKQPSTQILIDAHTHLDLYKDEDLENVLKEISEHQIFTLSNSIGPSSYYRNLEISRQCDLVLPSFGIHPWWAVEHVAQLEDFVPLIEQSPILGEIGLDYHWVKDKALYLAQRQVFEFFLAAARNQNKLVSLHTKGAEAEVLSLLDQYHIQRAIIHWYSGPLDILDKLVDQKFYFTIGVEVIRSEHIQSIARKIPLRQLLTETDNPDGYEWLTGTLGMPRHIKDVINKVAQLKQMEVEEVIRTVQENFTHLVQNDPWLEAEVGLSRYVSTKPIYLGGE